MRPLLRHRRLLTVSLMFIAGCQIDLPLASSIEHMRILAAIAEVDGDSQRSSPKPGETVHVTWEMAFPDPKQDNSELSTLFYTCTAPSFVSGTPVCQELIDLAADAIRTGKPADAASAGLGDLGEQSPCADAPDSTFELGPFQLVCVTGTPKLDIKIPDNYKADAKLMRGVTCRNGTPRFNSKNPTDLLCDHANSNGASDSEEISFYGTVPVQHDADTENHNPSTDALTLDFHDPPLMWEATDAELEQELSDDTCEDLATSGRVMSSDGHEETITLRYDADAREASMGKPEALTFSAYTTYGEISDRFTLFRSDAKAPLKRTITWQLSDEQRAKLKKSSKYVRFYFTASDGRGGYAITHRDLCVVR